MDDECETQREANARLAEKVGAWYYDPNSQVIWKQYIVGLVPRWRRILWWFFPPSHTAMRLMQTRWHEKQTQRLCQRAHPSWRYGELPLLALMTGFLLLGDIGRQSLAQISNPRLVRHQLSITTVDVIGR